MNAMKTFTRLASAGVSAMILTCTLAGFAATTNVFVGAGGTLTFSPSTLTINQGDQIIWTWQGNFHSTTSGTLSGTPPTATPNPNGIWDSGVFSQPHSFTNSFPSAGNFPFYCSIHYNSSMTGAVNVAAAPVPVVLSAPQFFPPAHFRFDYTADTNQSYIVQRSTDLSSSNWTTLGTNQPAGSPVIFDDTNAMVNPAFYRVGRLPIP